MLSRIFLHEKFGIFFAHERGACAPLRNNCNADWTDDADFRGFFRFRVDTDQVLSPLVEKQVNSKAEKSAKIRVIRPIRVAIIPKRRASAHPAPTLFYKKMKSI